MRKFYLILLIGLAGLIVIFGIWLLASAPGLPSSWRRVIGETVGLGVLKGEQDDEVAQVDSGEPWHERKGVWTGQPTVFADELQQQRNAHIFSRGKGEDGFERVMIRGQFGGWNKTPVGVVTGRRSLTVTTAGGAREVHVGRTVQMHCESSVFYDRDGKAYDARQVMMEYVVYLDTAEIVETDRVMDVFQPGDEMALIARYSDGVFEAMLLVGFDCRM